LEGTGEERKSSGKSMHHWQHWSRDKSIDLNFLNGVEAKGFSLEYLQRVPEVKDTVHKHSLLHHLVQMVVEQFPTSGDLYSELGSAVRASRVDYDEVSKALVKMESDCKSSWSYFKTIAKVDPAVLQAKPRMADFLSDCAERIQILQVVQRRVMNRFKKSCLFLGFSSLVAKELKSHSLMKILSEFALEYRTLRERFKEGQEKKACRRERAKRMTHSNSCPEGSPVTPSQESQQDNELRRILRSGFGGHGDSDVHLNGSRTPRTLRTPASRVPVTHSHADKIFGDSRLKAKLEAIVWPETDALVQQEIYFLFLFDVYFRKTRR